MRQSSILHLQAEVLALQCVLSALLQELPANTRAGLERRLQVQADRARVRILGARGAAPVMAAFDEMLERCSA